MHILVSNHDAEVTAYQRALGTVAVDLKVVENNLSVLSLISTKPLDIWSLVITAHQDEGINVETHTFLRNLSERAAGLWPTVVVDPSFAELHHPSVRVVDTIEEAAALVQSFEQPELLAASVETTPTHKSNGNGNGHGHIDVATTWTIARSEPTVLGDTSTFTFGEREVPEYVPVGRNVAPAEKTWEPTTAPVETQPPVAEVVEPAAAAHAAPPQMSPAIPVWTETVPSLPAPTPPPPAEGIADISAPERTFEGMSEPARSLADDIRDWTDRNEQQRGQHHVASHEKSLWQGLIELLPANRRLAAEEEALNAAIRAPRLSRCQSIAVISPKGGVGKSFLTYLIGNFLAEVRGDKIVAIDTNPDFGTLADQVRGREQQTVSTLLERIDEIKHYSDLRRFTSKVQSRLEVLAAPADPDVMASITSQDYSVVNTQLQHYYDTVMFDCGTGFRDDITRFALEQADQVVLVSAPLFITTGIVVRALGYLDQVGVPLDRVTLAINQVRREKPLDLDYMRERFGTRLNAIVEIPFDIQLYHDLDRGEFSVDHTQQSTRIKVKQLLTELVKHFE